jgi:hypothetical protein
MSNEIELMREIAKLQWQIDALRTIQQGWQPVFLSYPLTSTSYDGNDTVNVGAHTINTSAVFGAPTGIKMAAVFFRATWSSVNAGYSLGIRPVGASLYVAAVYSQVANIPIAGFGIVTCDANGDFDLVVGGANALNVIMRITDYWK